MIFCVSLLCVRFGEGRTLTFGLKRTMVCTRFTPDIIYICCRLKQRIHNADLEALPSLNHLFRECWQLFTPQKVKVFIWKILRNALAVNARLKDRGISGVLGCVFCDHEIESINHLFFECPAARLIWALSDVPSAMHGFSSSLFDNMHHVFQQVKRKDLPMEIRLVVPWILWRIWKNRNKAVFENKRFEGVESVMKAYEDVREWTIAHETNVEESEQQASVDLGWRKPPPGRVKCNLASSWSKTSLNAGVAWVLRDEQGVVIIHSRRSYANIHVQLEAKMVAWEWAIESMNSLRVNDVIFAASTPELIKALKQPDDWPSMLGFLLPLLQTIQSHHDWSFICESHKCNLAATCIAKSVTQDLRLNSYVRRGAPTWLKGLFHDEAK